MQNEEAIKKVAEFFEQIRRSKKLTDLKSYVGDLDDDLKKAMQE